MESRKTPLLVGLIVLIVAAVGLIIYQMSGSERLSERQQADIAATQQGAPGSFTPAPR